MAGLGPRNPHRRDGRLNSLTGGVSRRHDPPRDMVFVVPLPRSPCVASISCAASLGLCLMLSTLRANAQESCLDFRAEQMTLDPKDESIELVGDVDVWCGPYQLRSDSLRVLSRSGQVHVEGPASLTLCPCDRAPISMGFRQADIRPSGDVTLDEPSLVLGNTRVFWLPWMWLRAPNRFGLLVPRLAWRGDGGLLAGPGVRIPWQESDGSKAWMDLYVSGYARGGFEL
jgi:lipopolysaccharide assembly outer membrane protein LptD (OstA)